jgi:hypothetical protein
LGGSKTGKSVKKVVDFVVVEASSKRDRVDDIMDWSPKRSVKPGNVPAKNTKDA